MTSISTHQQSLTDAGSDTRPPVLERGSCVPLCKEGHLYYKGESAEVERFRRRLGMEMYTYFYELRHLQEMLLMFSATTAMLKATMQENVQSQEFGIPSTF
ncbi:hypothetical protein Tco_1193124 [Tanacetum coccineum]